MKYAFTLKYQLANAGSDPNALKERLSKASCGDAQVFLGQPGRLALAFAREADSAEAAVQGALEDVRRAAPLAKLIEATPDLVGLTEVAEIVGLSRQNMRTQMLAHHASFPAPVHEGNPTIWHLAEVLAWLQARGYAVAQDVFEVSQAALQINVTKEKRRMQSPPSGALEALLG
jgi:predicted DNA-binding transcriptional regulator AlpA